LLLSQPVIEMGKMTNGLHLTVRSADEDLSCLPFFRGASQATLARAALTARWFSVEADQLLFDYGDECTDVFLLVSGALRVSIRTGLVLQPGFTLRALCSSAPMGAPGALLMFPSPC
jgi:CRP-like cAMP-binding protein